MLKIKSRAALAFAGLMVAAFMLVAGVAVNTASADMVALPSAGVSKSSSMENIKNLQSFLNWTLGAQITPLVVDGIYGPKTTAAIKMYQSANGLVPDGMFGPLSSAKAAALMANMGGATYPAGCASAAGFSSTTGAPCSGGTYPAGCTSAAGFSPLTGVPCSSSVGTTLPAGCATAAGFSVTTGMPCTTTTGVSGTNGYLTDIASDSTGRVSTVYESEQDKVVAGFRATARLSSQTVNRVRVQMRNTDSVGSSANLAKYISSASLWFGSTKIATMSVTDADRSTSDDTYTFNFSGINAMVAKDQIGRFYVSVSANGSLDSTDATNANWAVTFPDGGVQAVSPDGSVDTYNASLGNVGTLTGSNVGFTFGKFSANGVKATVGLSSSNPAASIVPVSSTGATNGVTVLKFTVKATNSDLTLRKVPIQITSTTANVSNIINTIKLYNGSNVVDSLDGSAFIDVNTGTCTPGDTSLNTITTGCYQFTNLADPFNKIASGATSEFSVVVDLKKADGVNYSEGDSLTASFTNADAVLTANFGVLDVNGDQVPATSTYRVGSAVGEVQTLRVNGVNVTMGGATITTVTDAGVVTSITYNIPLTVTAFGNTVYTGQIGQFATAASGTGASAGAFAFTLRDATAPATPVTSNPTGLSVTSTLSSTDATVENLGFRLDSGSAKHFTLQVIVSCTASGCSTATTTNYRVNVGELETFATNALAATAVHQLLLPTNNFNTSYQKVK